MPKLLSKPTVTKEFLPLSFSIENEGWYLIHVSTRVKSEKQLGRNETDDEDLRIEVDGEKFPQLKNPHRHLDSPAAFSGGKLHNLLKTVYFVLRFEAGNHTISLIPDKSALVEHIEIVKLKNFPHLHLDLRKQAEKGNNRPWLTFVLVGLGLKTLKLAGKVRWRFPDGDDLKLIIDGRIKKNNLSVLHRNWIFASNLLKKILGREDFEQTFEENLPLQDLHYLEIWADESPTLHSVALELTPEKSEQQITQTYRPGPNGENYNRFDEEIFEAVKYWNDFFLAQKYPPTEHLDPNLVKAIIFIESRVGYGISVTGYPSYPDVMQVGNPADFTLNILNNDGQKPTEYEAWSGNEEPLDYKGEAKVENTYDSIHWGTRWLYHKAQNAGVGSKQIWYSWEKAVGRYGPGTQEYTQSVWNLYQKGVNPDGGENLF